MSNTMVRPGTTSEDRAERLKQLSHKFGRKPARQTRSNDRRKAIRESREAA